MRRFFAWLRAFFGFAPQAKWEDGAVVTDLDHYRALYADTVAWIQARRPETIQAPTLVATIRRYDRWPPGFEYNMGKVLAPNTIVGDTGGTICLGLHYPGRSDANDDAVFVHEARHCITGIGDEAPWLFSEPEGTL